jgi:probable rRNA maturation factor
MGDDQPPALRVGVVDARGRAARVPGLAQWLAGVAPRAARGTVTVALVSDARMRALNREFRGLDYATDVLSFPAAPPDGVGAAGLAPGSTPLGPGSAPGPRRRAPRIRTLARGAGPRVLRSVHLGDIVIATGVAARQARAVGHARAAELRVLALHGLLHLLGYDHDTDRGEMRRVEARLRRRGGLPGGLIERGAHR